MCRVSAEAALSVAAVLLQALQALLAMAPVCLEQYRSDSSLLLSLGYLKDQYQELVHSERILGEEDSYFGEILDLLLALELKMK